jgi:ribosomal protein L11 methyltransferase
MFVWRKRAGARWLAANEVALREIAGRRLAIVFKPAHRNAIAEIASPNSSELDKIRTRFGGVIEKLPRNWFRKSLSGQNTRPLKIGKRLVIVSSTAGRRLKRMLVIPASAAFGTGEHVTTAMSLRMLERLTRKSVARGAQCGTRVRSRDKGFFLLDLGTGSGILALAAARFGANRITAIDHDPIAIATAKENARRNKIKQVDFRIADIRRLRFPARIDIIAANLFSELLIEILPKLKFAEWLILSGVLRSQEPRLLRALKRNGIAVREKRRRGKWVALLAMGPLCHPERSEGPPILGDRTI